MELELGPVAPGGNEPGDFDGLAASDLLDAMLVAGPDRGALESPRGIGEGEDGVRVVAGPGFDLLNQGGHPHFSTRWCVQFCAGW